MNNGVSIIVVSYNIAPSLQRCLDSYLNLIDSATDEIIVIDNNSTDHSADMVEKNFPNVKPVSYTHLRAHETVLDLVCRLLLEKQKTQKKTKKNTHISRTHA